MFGNAKLSDIMFEVKSLPVYIPDNVDPETNTFTEISLFKGKQALVREDTGAHLGIVGSKYTPVNNQAVLDKFDDMCTKAGIRYEIGDVLMKDNGSRTSMEIVFPDKFIELKSHRSNDDKMQLRGYLHNDFTGTKKVSLELGFFRYWCSNGAIVGSKDYNLSFMHFSKTEGRIVDAFNMYLEKQFDETQDFIKLLTDTRFEKDTDIEYEFKHQDIVTEKYQDTLIDIWQKEEQSSLSMWSIYNVYTYMISHAMEKINAFKKLEMLKQVTDRSKEIWLHGNEIIIDNPR